MTGAVILVALVVLVVPELLSGRHHTEPQPTIPGEPPIRSYTIPLQSVSGAPVTQAGSLHPVAASPQAASVAASSSASARPEVAAGAKITPVAAAKSPHGGAIRTEVSSAEPTREKRADAAPEAPVPRARPEHPASRRATGAGWSIQVGSFIGRDHAESFARTLRGRGYRVSVSASLSRGRRWYRVQVGPERDRATALAVERRLRAQGHAGELIRGP